ncbi:neprilysin-2-like [Stegodyphus dumicola]|uniref:neprilysin-2-like n=1 Tax=Stegodyphus dumicola TaxID=202533 RepID=UPI0015ACBCC6|nr:neprilysin-2-like [Stegodyphus dumicola]
MVDSTTAYIGHPDILINRSFLELLYSNLTLGNESYFDKEMKVRKWSADYSFLRLQRPEFSETWLEHANITSVKYFYNHKKSTFDFPVALLQKPFFNKDRPNYLNFGTIGFLIGQELTRGLIDKGLHYKNGKTNLWLNPNVNCAFEPTAKCLIKQYSNYTGYISSSTGYSLKINGTGTLPQNVADNGGLIVAYKAYQSWLTRNREPQILPGVNYTPNQLFWISAANMLCQKQTDTYLENQVLTGSKTPSKIRVNGAVANLREFANDFNCAASEMDATNMCRVW